MSGFLHQFAARSLGLTPQIRPRAALPYAAPALELPAENPSLGADRPGLTAAPSAAPPAPEAIGQVPEPATALPMPLIGQLRLNHAETDANIGRLAAPNGLEPARVPALPAAPAAIEAGDAGSPSGHRETAAATPSHASTAVAPPIPEEALPSDAERRTSVGDDAVRFDDLETLVARLLRQDASQNSPSASPAAAPASAPLAPSVTRPAAVSALRPQAVREAPPRAPDRPAPEPEVHITIGRLEVNPPSRPAPPPPRPRGPAPLSLPDYLARRSGGRS